LNFGGEAGEEGEQAEDDVFAGPDEKEGGGGGKKKPHVRKVVMGDVL
jgi:hypothetical protein